MEEALTFLLEKNEPKDNRIGHYRRTIDRELKQMLKVREDEQVKANSDFNLAMYVQNLLITL